MPALLFSLCSGHRCALGLRRNPAGPAAPTCCVSSGPWGEGVLLSTRCSCVGLRAGEMEANNKCERGRLDYKDPSPNYSTAVSSCFKEAGGKLAVFTANIVERLSHPNKTEAQERKKGGWGRGTGSMHPNPLKRPRPQSRHRPLQIVPVVWRLPLARGPGRGRCASGGPLPSRAESRAAGRGVPGSSRFEVRAEVTRWTSASPAGRCSAGLLPLPVSPLTSSGS